MTLGTIFQVTGAEPHVSAPLKGDYVRRDWARRARRMEVPFALPARFPFPSAPAVRAYYWLFDQDRARARDLARGVYREAFAEGGAAATAESVASVGESLGVSPTELLAWISSAKAEDRVKREVDAALARGVFGSPLMIVDGEPFWGVDRLGELEEWLLEGGW